ncbi:MAG: hypothetical protein LBU06_04535 [Desulfovibrio sp.]|nr:hypothetical protein [Desulfovibrio sp.]
MSGEEDRAIEQFLKNIWYIHNLYYKHTPGKMSRLIAAARVTTYEGQLLTGIAAATLQSYVENTLKLQSNDDIPLLELITVAKYEDYMMNPLRGPYNSFIKDNIDVFINKKYLPLYNDMCSQYFNMDNMQAKLYEIQVHVLAEYFKMYPPKNGDTIINATNRAEASATASVTNNIFLNITPGSLWASTAPAGKAEQPVQTEAPVKEDVTKADIPPSAGHAEQLAQKPEENIIPKIWITGQKLMDEYDITQDAIYEAHHAGKITAYYSSTECDRDIAYARRNENSVDPEEASDIGFRLLGKDSVPKARFLRAEVAPWVPRLLEEKRGSHHAAQAEAPAGEDAGNAETPNFIGQAEQSAHTETESHIQQWQALLPELKGAERTAAKLAIEKLRGATHEQAYKAAFPNKKNQEPRVFVSKKKIEAQKLAKKNSLTMPIWDTRV